MRRQLEEIFSRAFAQFLKAERKNILNGTSEPNLCGRLAMVLDAERARAGLTEYFVDTEYNRNGAELKTIIEENAQS